MSDVRINANEKRQAYYCSREWGLKKEAVHERSGGICERCKKNEGDAVHHKTYARLYNENLEDLVHLCEECHSFTHGKTHFDPAVVKLKPVRVYLAGPVVNDNNKYTIDLAQQYEEYKKQNEEYKQEVLSPEDWAEQCLCSMIDCWRDDIFDCTDQHGGIQDELLRVVGRFAYGGPIIETGGGHRMANNSHSLGDGDFYRPIGTNAWLRYISSETREPSRAEFCLWQLKQCDVLFAWIDREETVGTIAEITLARAFNIPIFLAFETEKLAQYFYFVAAFADPNASIISPTPKEAWAEFEKWCERENRSWWRTEISNGRMMRGLVK